MTTVKLSQENIRRLEELEFGHAAEPIELEFAPVTNGSARRDGERAHTQRQREEEDEAVAVQKARRILETPLGATAVHDAALRVFACLYLHFASTTSLMTPQSQSLLDHAKDAQQQQPESADERWQSLNDDDVDELSVAKQSLVAALVSATLCCGLDATDTHRDALVAEAGLASLLLLQFTTESVSLAASALAHIAAYTDPHNSWTTQPAALFANRILDLQTATRTDSRQLIADILASDIARPGPQHHRQKSTTVLEWALKRAEVGNGHEDETSFQRSVINRSSSGNTDDRAEYVARHWHLFVPFLIDLIESHETTAKKKALDLVIIFLAKCPATTLTNTGTDRLLESSIFPSLHLLPPLTLENDSAALLAAAYQALTDIAVKDLALKGRSSRRLLDKLFREGILQSHQYASEYAQVTTVLLQNTGKVVSCLGIFATKHLSVSIADTKRQMLMLIMEKNLLRLIESVMCDDLSLQHPELLMAASETLVLVIRNCWPRMRTAQRLEQVLRVLGICWLNLHESMKEGASPSPRPSDASDVKRRIRDVASTLRSMAKDDYELIMPRLERVCVQDNRLEDLFMD
ncbi:hypothetical protein E4U41_007731 [Claviceps citrina]|nr:hypothetical protein E4U41_007731 [Claviceps citrina]